MCSEGQLLSQMNGWRSEAKRSAATLYQGEAAESRAISQMATGIAKKSWINRRREVDARRVNW